MTEKTLIIQHNDIINSRYNMSSWEQRIVKLLISMIGPEDDNFKFYRLSSSEISEAFGLNHKDVYKELKAAASRLKKRPLYIQIRKGRELELSWVASAEYIDDEGIIELEISAKLKPYLLQLKDRFTKYEFGNLLNLRRQYSFRLFDIVKQYQYKKNCRFTVENIRYLLDIGDDKYKLYKDFKKYALQPAVDEIKENTDIDFDMVEIRKWKTVVEIEFCNIRHQERKKSVIQTLNLLPSDKNDIVDDELNNPIVLHLVNFGILQKVAEEIIREYDEARIKAAIFYTEAQQKEGKVKALNGFRSVRMAHLEELGYVPRTEPDLTG